MEEKPDALMQKTTELEDVAGVQGGSQINLACKAPDGKEEDHDDGCVCAFEEPVMPGVPPEEVMNKQLNDSELGQQKALRQEAHDLEPGDIAQAVAKYTEAIMLGGVNAMMFAKRAEMLFKQRRYRAVVVDTTEALRLNPCNGKALQLRGKANRYLGEYGKSAQDLRKSQEIFPDEAVADLLEDVERRLVELKEKQVLAHPSPVALPPTSTVMVVPREECVAASSSSSETVVSNGGLLQTEGSVLAALLATPPMWDHHIPEYSAWLRATFERHQRVDRSESIDALISEHSNRSANDDPCKLKDFEVPQFRWNVEMVIALKNIAASLQAKAKESADEVVSEVTGSVVEAEQIDQEKLSQDLENLRTDMLETLLQASNSLGDIVCPNEAKGLLEILFSVDGAKVDDMSREDRSKRFEEIKVQRIRQQETAASDAAQAILAGSSLDFLRVDDIHRQKSRADELGLTMQVAEQKLQEMRSVVKCLKSEGVSFNELQARCEQEQQTRSDLRREALTELKNALRTLQIKEAVYHDRLIEELAVRIRLQEIHQIGVVKQAQDAAADEASEAGEKVFEDCLREQRSQSEFINNHVEAAVKSVVTRSSASLGIACMNSRIATTLLKRSLENRSLELAMLMDKNKELEVELDTWKKQKSKASHRMTAELRDEIQDHKQQIASCELKQQAISNSIKDAENRCCQLEELGKFGAIIPLQDHLVDMSQDLVSRHYQDFQLWPNGSAVDEDVGPTNVGDTLQIRLPSALAPDQMEHLKAALGPHIREVAEQLLADKLLRDKDHSVVSDESWIEPDGV